MEDFLNSLKGFVLPFVVRWILKIGGTYLATIGISENSVYEVVGGIVAVLIGLVISLFNHKKAIKTPVS